MNKKVVWMGVSHMVLGFVLGMSISVYRSEFYLPVNYFVTLFISFAFAFTMSSVLSSELKSIKQTGGKNGIVKGSSTGIHPKANQEHRRS